jgi:hypothetical protein
MRWFFLCAMLFISLSMAIVKILARHSPSYSSLVKYILRYIGDDAKTHKTRFYTQNLRSDTIEGFVSEFIENEAFRRNIRSDQVHLFHEIVSFHAGEDRDAMTEAMIDDLASEYMRLRGSTGVILGACHRDKDHIHLHFCVSALHYRTGKSFGLNRAQMRELKQSFQQHHKEHYPQLTKSFPQHGKATRYVANSQWHKHRREQIKNTVQQCLAESSTQREFLERLCDRGLHHYERNGKPMGIEHDGLKFRFSRLLPDCQFENLAVDRGEEDRALADIQAVRKRQQERDGREHDTENRER